MIFKNKINIFKKKTNKIVYPTKEELDENAIIIDHLKVVFNEKMKEEFVALEDIDYKFKKGQIYFIIGNSGTGKTTLVSHFNALLKSRHGNIFIGDNTIYGFKKKVKNIKKLRKHVGMVFQFPEYQLFKDTIEKDIMFGPMNLGASKQEAKELAKKYIKMVGLNESFLDRSPFNLSGGQKRRVSLAGILAIEPEIIVFDEPTAGLDPAGCEEMMSIILELKKMNKTVFVITHVMDHVLQVADQVVVMGDKKILVVDEPYEIFKNKKLINDNSLDTPKIIKVIDELIEINELFKSLYEQKPRSVKQLAKNIYDLIKNQQTKESA